MRVSLNPLTSNDHYSGHTAPLTSKRCILYIYSTNIVAEYFKHGIYSPFFSLQNAVCFIILTYLVPVLSTFYLQGVLKLKKNSGAKRLNETVQQLKPATSESHCANYPVPAMSWRYEANKSHLMRQNLNSLLLLQLWTPSDFRFRTKSWRHNK